jgi:hemerythrin-like domain-containing protein
MNNVLRALLIEHEHIRKMLICFDEQLAVFERAEPPDYDILSDSLAYCKDYLDVWHHPREDRLLGLLRQRDAGKVNSLAELDDQHKGLARNTVQVVRVFKDVAERGAVRLREDLLRSGRELANAYRHHLTWEEAHFFPALDRTLEPGDWDVAQSDAARGEAAANAVRNRYPALFRAIEEKV